MARRNERMMELWMVRIVSQQEENMWQEWEKASQRYRDYDKVGGETEKWGVDSKDYDKAYRKNT